MPRQNKEDTYVEGSRVFRAYDQDLVQDGPPAGVAKRRQVETGRAAEDFFRATEAFPENIFRVPVPNRVFSGLGDKEALPGTALKALLACIALSFRFHDGSWSRPDRALTTSEIASASGLSGQGTRDGLSVLADRGLVKTASSGGRFEHTLQLDPPTRRYTYLPISLLSDVADLGLTDTSLRVLLIVFHRTWGHTRSADQTVEDAPEHRRWARLPVSAIARQAGCTERSVKSAVSTLNGRYLRRRRPNGTYYYRPLVAPFTDPNTDSDGDEKPKSNGETDEKGRRYRAFDRHSDRRCMRAFFSMPLPNEFHHSGQNISCPNAGESVSLRKTVHSQGQRRKRVEEHRQETSAGVVSSRASSDLAKSSAERHSGETPSPMPQSLRQFAKGRMSASELKAISTEERGTSGSRTEELSDRQKPDTCRLSSSTSRATCKDTHSSPPSSSSQSNPEPTSPPERRGRTSGTAPPRPNGSAHRSSTHDEANQGESAPKEDLSAQQKQMVRRLVNCGVWPRRARAFVRRFSRERIQLNFEYYRARATVVQNSGAYLAQAISEGYRLPPADPNSSAGFSSDDGSEGCDPKGSQSQGACPTLSPGDVVGESRKQSLIASGRATPTDFTRCDSRRREKTYIYRLNQ